MGHLSRRAQFGLAVVVELIIALAVYMWCFLQGSCTGECLAGGYVVAQTCLGLAFKTLAGLLLATGVAFFLTRK